MKMYPFSVQKHAHDIEFRRNRVKNTIDAIHMKKFFCTEENLQKLYVLEEKLTDLLLAIMSGNGVVCYLTGEQIALAKESVLWANDTRAETQRNKGH